MADVPFMASVHARLFKGVLSARLGAAHLEAFYGGLVKGRGTACFVAESAGRQTGFICGSSWHGAGGLSFWELLSHAAAALARGRIAPSELPGIIQYRRWASAVRLPAELVSLAVLPESQGVGAGKLLTGALTDFFRASGIKEFCVFTNTLVPTGLPFYLRQGYEALGEYDHGENKTVCLRRKIQ